MSVSRSTELRYQQSDPDVRLMMRVAGDDAGAFAELVARYESRLVRLMRSIGPRPDLAEDLAQETFLRLFRARARYVAGAKFSTYLYTIAGNVARNSHRTINRRREHNEADAPQNVDISGAAPITTMLADNSGMMPSRQMERDERALLVRRAIESLGERQRMALMLSRFEHLNYNEIAETMGLSTKAVKSLLSRARVSVRDQLSGYIDGDDAINGDAADETAAAANSGPIGGSRPSRAIAPESER